MVLPFEEVASSDEDSISITSTRSSDPEAEYNVEKILAEQVHEDGVRRYLLKWEGYPLHSATWEPAENLLGAQLLSNWEAEKAEIRAGTRSPFDVLEHEAAQEEHIAEKQKRHRRRVAKRRKRGLPSGDTSDGSADDVAMRDGDSEDERPPAAARQKRVKAVAPKRKGVAVKVTKKSSRQAAAAESSSDENSDEEMSVSDDSLVEEARNQQRANKNGNQSTSTSRSAAPPAPLRARGTANALAKAANKVTKTASSIQKPASARKTSASSSANPKSADRSLPSSSARKSAPSTASFGPTETTTSTRLPVLPTDPPKRSSTGNVTMTLNPTPGPRARRISESDPRHQRYANLSEQNRFLKHSRKEGAPDPSMLGTFNAATGKFDEPAARAAGDSSASTIPSVFGRRDAPAPTRKRSLSPPSPRAAAPSALTDDNTTPYTRVCWDWRNSTCTKPPGTCIFAHHYITCPHWKNGYCNKSEKDCRFDHREGRDPVKPRREQAFPAPSAFPPPNIPSRQPPSFQQSPVRQAPGMSPPSVQHSPMHQVSGMSPPSVQQSPLHQVSGMSSPHVPSHEEVRAPLERRGLSSPIDSRLSARKPTRPMVLSLKDIACRDFMRGYCRFGDGCRQAHGHTDFDIRLGDVTCFHWYDGDYCNKGDRCVFAHRLTEYRIEQPGSGVFHFRPFNTDPSGERNAPLLTEAAANTRPTNTSQKQRPPEHLVTCYFWLKGHCFKGDRCHFAHYLTEWRAGTPGTGHITHVPMAGDPSDKTNVASLTEAGSRRQSLKESRAVDIPADDAMDTDDGPSLNAPATSSNAVPVSRKSSSSVQKQVVEPAPAQDTTSAVTSGDALPTDAPTRVSEHQQTDGSNDKPSSMSAKDLLAMNMERLLNISDVKKEDRVFIMMPETKAPEIQLIAKMFEERFKKPDYKGRQCKVWTSLEPGSWELCLKSSTCLLLIHPEVPLWDIPYLGKALHDRVFRVFSINLDPASAALDQNDPNATCRRLFPMGDVVFLTDDVFLHKPGKVLAIIDKINKSNKAKPLGATRNKIATRPGIKAWLADLVINQKEGTDDPRLSMLLTEIWKLCPIEKENEEYPGHPSENADVISLAPEQLPTFQALVQTDRVKATDYIVNWFAGWAFMNASKFRRFTVCHEEPGTGEKVLDKDYNLVTKGIADPRDWGKAFKYLLVKTPDQWIEKEEAKVRPTERS